jgi:nicotinic acid mononucleotide adenylyltransferase
LPPFSRRGQRFPKDLVEGFHSWKDADLVAREVDLIVARRDTVRKKELDFEHVYLNNRVIDAASSDIREMVRKGEPIDGYVPEAVQRYIDEHTLYRREARN